MWWTVHKYGSVGRNLGGEGCGERVGLGEWGRGEGGDEGKGLEGGLIYCSDLSDCDLRVAGAKAFTEIIIGKSINPNNVCWDRFI